MSCEVTDSACKHTGEVLDARIYEVLWSEGDDGCGEGGGVPFGTSKVAPQNLVLCHSMLHV